MSVAPRWCAFDASRETGAKLLRSTQFQHGPSRCRGACDVEGESAMRAKLSTLAPSADGA